MAAIFGNQKDVPKGCILRNLGCCGCEFDRLLRQKLSYTVRQLCAVAGPILNPVALQVNGRRVRAWIVGANHLDRTAIAGAILFNHNDAIVGLLTRSNAR
jgi:hypothetical protein